MASNTASVKRLLKAYTKGDFDAFAEVAAPKLRWRQNAPTGYFGFARERNSVTGVKSALRELNAEYEFPRWDAVEFTEQGNVVWVLVKGVARRRKSKSKHRFELAQRWEFRRGKIVRYAEFLDTASLLIAERRIAAKG
jgi:ketosteroid isomerase-like protein